jgi:hypothetical protein
MIRKFLVLLLIESIAFSTALAQTSDAAGPVVSAATKQTSLEIATSVVRRENKLRRGHDTELAVLLAPDNLDPMPPGHLRLPVVLKSVRLEPMEGLSIRYTDFRGKKFSKAEWGKPTFTKAGTAVLLKVHADKKLNLGEYTLKGKIRYQLLAPGRVPAEKEIELMVPVTVVDQNEAVPLNAWRYQPVSYHELRNGFVGILLLPLIIPLFLLYVLLCDRTNECS